MFYCVTQDNLKQDEPDKGLIAHGYDTKAEAEAFDDAIEMVLDTELRSRGVYEAGSEEAAIAAYLTEHPEEEPGDDYDDFDAADDDEFEDDDDDEF